MGSVLWAGRRFKGRRSARPKFLVLLLWLMAWALVLGDQAGCRGSHTRKHGPAGAALPAIEIKEGADLLFVYRSGEDFHTVTKIADVPVWARSWVRVLDPKVKGAKGGWVYVADLCHPGKGGRYPYRVVQLSTFESKGPLSCSGGGAPPKIVAYVSTTCPVCAKALAYLKSRGIPFVAKTVDKDPDAARELARKAAAAGVNVRGVPVFDIGGKLIQGFDPQVFERFAGGR